MRGAELWAGSECGVPTPPKDDAVMVCARAGDMHEEKKKTKAPEEYM